MASQTIDQFTATTSLVAGDIMYGLRGGVTDLSVDIIAALKSYMSANVGVIRPFSGRVTPSGHLLADGTAVSRALYPTLFDKLCYTVGTGTITIAAPGVVTLVAHGFTTGDSLYITTTGALPTGLSVNTLYYAITVTADTFRLATSRANALVPTPITTTGSQSGTHTFIDCAWGLGDGATTFNLPDLRESVLVGTGTRGAGVTAHDTFNLGEFKDDMAQGWQAGFTSGGTTYYGGPGVAGAGSRTSTSALANYYNTDFASTLQGSAAKVTAFSDGTNGTPRTGTTTRTKQVGVRYAVQYE